MKTSELTGAALDWAVAKCEGWEWRCPWMLEKDGYVAWQRYETAWGSPTPNYSTDWSQGGSIIEREEMGVQCIPAGSRKGWWALVTSRFHDRSTPDEMHGDTPLIAAMRCYVASKLGDEVDVPTELTSYP